MFEIYTAICIFGILSFLSHTVVDILNIDYVWLLKNLVKLSLAHNVIERIENLDELIHLKELDLSFNRIKVMENLDNLDQLEILLLYSNEISIVQGINNLKKLVILNIGKNKINDWKHVCAYTRCVSLCSFFFIHIASLLFIKFY